MPISSFKEYLHTLGVVKDKKYVIIGFSKCGTTSLFQYGEENGFDILKRDSWLYNLTNAQEKEEIKDRELIVMFRNPIERAWSHYWFLFRQKMSRDTPFHIKQDRWKEVCAKSVYKNYLPKYKGQKLIMISQEVAKRFKDFPHGNKNITSKESITPKNKKDMQKLMNMYGARGGDFDYVNGWHISRNRF